MTRLTVLAALALTAAVGAADPVRFSDTFEVVPNPDWTGFPAQSERREEALVVPGANGGTRLTTRDRFRYGRYTVRFQVLGVAPQNYVYFGFFTREPWGANLCGVILDGGRFRLQVRREGGKVVEPFETPPVTADAWHTLAIDWQPEHAELLWDGQSCGRLDQADCLPDTFVTGFLDVVQSGTPKLEVLVASVQIEGSQVRRADRSGLGGPRPPLRTPPETKLLTWPDQTPPEVAVAASGAVLRNAFYRAELTWDGGLRLARLENRVAGLLCLAPGACSELFLVASGPKLFPSSGFRVTDAAARQAEVGQTLVLEAATADGAWRASLALTTDASPEMRLHLEVTSTAPAAQPAIVCWPHLSGLQLGEDPTANYYLFPWKGGWCNNRPMALAAVYGQATGLMQVFALFSPAGGAALYTYTKDDSGRVKTFAMRKQDQPDTDVSSYMPLGDETRPEKGVLTETLGTQLSVRHLPWTFAPGQPRALPDAVLAVAPGDWRPALRSYAAWTHSWMQDPGVPEWYKAVFHTVAVHDEVGNRGFEHGFLKDDQWALAEQARPGDGLLEVVHWWNHPDSDGVEPPRQGKRGWYKHTIGQYDYWDELGGVARLRQEIAGVHAKGVRVNLYACPYFAWEFCEVRKAHPDWVLRNADGSISRDWSAVVGDLHIRQDDMCYAIPGWREFMAATAGRIVRDTGADGVYLDTMNQHKFCYSPDHQHPESPAVSAEAMLQAIRAAAKAANPQAVVTCEDLCSERLAQFVDGSLIKTFEGTQPEYSDYDLYSLHFARFYFPGTKLVEWGSTFADGARRAFFNGVGYMRGDLGGTRDPFTGKTLTPEEQLAYLARTSAILSANADAFASLEVEPLVPTLVPRVYANRFTGKGQVVWTLYNRSGQDLAQDLLAVEHHAGARYSDLWRDQALAPVVQDGKALLRLPLTNGQVTVVAQRLPSWRPAAPR